MTVLWLTLTAVITTLRLLTLWVLLLKFVVYVTNIPAIERMVKDCTSWQLAQSLVLEVIDDVVDHDVHCYISQQSIFPHQVLVTWNVQQPHVQILMRDQRPYFLIGQPCHEQVAVLLIQAIGVGRRDAIFY